MRGSHRRRAAAPLAGAVVLALALGACSGSDDEGDQDQSKNPGTPARPAAVALEATDLPEGTTRIGVVLSLVSAPDEGSQWLKSAEGAQVAAYRFGLGDADVEIVPADDRGTTEGARRAVQDLAGDGVAGIVLGTSGSHVVGALEAAAAASLPVVMPYGTPPSVDGSDAWSTGPDTATVASSIARALDQSGSRSPALVDAGGGDIPQIDTAAEIPLGEGDRARNVASRLAGFADSGRIDSVVVSGPASQQATLVAALQGFAVDVPVFLTPDALSPVLAVDLADQGGSLSDDLVTVGDRATDVAALQATAEGRNVAAYFAGLRAAASDEGVEDYFDAKRFSTVADAADLRSHDAVVALVRAVEAAGSTDPSAVSASLGGMQLTSQEGLAGSDLDFSSPSALDRRAVVPLQATTQDPGLRPKTGGGAGPRLFWFAVPNQ